MQQGKSSGKASCRPHVKPAQVQMAVVQCAAVSQAKQVQFFLLLKRYVQIIIYVSSKFLFKFTNPHGFSVCEVSLRF